MIAIATTTKKADAPGRASKSDDEDNYPFQYNMLSQPGVVVKGNWSTKKKDGRPILSKAASQPGPDNARYTLPTLVPTNHKTSFTLQAGGNLSHAIVIPVDNRHVAFAVGTRLSGTILNSLGGEIVRAPALPAEDLSAGKTLTIEVEQQLNTRGSNRGTVQLTITVNGDVILDKAVPVALIGTSETFQGISPRRYGLSGMAPFSVTKAVLHSPVVVRGATPVR